MRPINLIIEDAVTLRGIVDLLEAKPATTKDIELTQHVGHSTAKRLCEKLQKAGVIERPTVPRVVLGVQQQVPQLAWRLTSALLRGEVEFNAEKLAGGGPR